jgi:hypothetical protein
MPGALKAKVMPIFVFDCECIQHYKYALQGKTINRHLYLQDLRCLHDLLCHKQPQSENLMSTKFSATVHKTCPVIPACAAVLS